MSVRRRLRKCRFYKGNWRLSASEGHGWWIVGAKEWTCRLFTMPASSIWGPSIYILFNGNPSRSMRKDTATPIHSRILHWPGSSASNVASWHHFRLQIIDRFHYFLNRTAVIDTASVLRNHILCRSMALVTYLIKRPRTVSWRWPAPTPVIGAVRLIRPV